jgi:hypothetical protein
MSATIRLRNVSPLGHLDVPEIGREGPAPHYGYCQSCTDDPTSDHEHELIKPDEMVGEGQGCLEPGEVFEVEDKLGKRLLEQVDNFEIAEPKKPKPRKRAAKKASASPADTSTTENPGNDDAKDGESA